MLLLGALSYGLIRVPVEAWEHRTAKITLGFHLFKVQTFVDDKQKAFENLQLQWMVAEVDLKILENLNFKAMNISSTTGPIGMIHSSLECHCSAKHRGFHRSCIGN